MDDARLRAYIDRGSPADEWLLAERCAFEHEGCAFEHEVRARPGAGAQLCLPEALPPSPTSDFNFATTASLPCRLPPASSLVSAPHCIP